MSSPSSHTTNSHHPTGDSNSTSNSGGGTITIDNTLTPMNHNSNSHPINHTKKRKLEENYTTPSPTESLDLGYLLATLSRDTLELLLVKIIHQHPHYANTLLQLSRKPYNTLELHHHLLNIFAYAYDTLYEIIQQLDGYIELIDSYTRADDLHNSVAICQTLCQDSIEWYIAERKRGDGDEDDDDRRSAEQYFSSLENVWSGIIEKMMVISDVKVDVNVNVKEKEKQSTDTSLSSSSDTPSTNKANNSNEQDIDLALASSTIYQPSTTSQTISYKEYETLLQKLQEWSQRLNQWVGPIFSDNIRVMKKKMKI